jgi:hypothetical protein
MHAITERLLPEQCPKMIYVRRTGAAYLLFDHLLDRVYMSEQKETLAESWKANALAVSAYGNLYLPASLVRTFLTEIANQLSKTGCEEAANMIAMSQFLVASIQAINHLNGENNPLTSLFKMAPEWASIHQIDDLKVGMTPSFGSGFRANTSVTFNSQSIH